MSETERERRTERRGRRQAAATVAQRPWRRMRLTYPPTAAVSADQLEAIHEASLTILEEVGMDILLPEAREIYRAAGAQPWRASGSVSTAALVLEAVAKAPAQFTLHARNPARNVGIGGDEITFCAVASAPNCSDLAGGRRPGSQTDFRNFMRLIQTLNIVQIIGGYPVEPVDLHPNIRHLECLRDFVTMTDKPFHAYSLGWGRIRDGIEIAPDRPRHRPRAARGRALALHHHQLELAAAARLRRWRPASSRWRSAGQVVIMTPFTLAGAMAPVTVAGALAQQNAEALAGIALTQLVRPGAPVVYGGFTSNVDMKSGAPAFGTPEYMKAVLVGGQLARRYGLPYRSSNVNAANHGRCPGRLRIGVLALGRGDGRRQRRQARGRLARGRARAPRSRRWCSTPTCCRWWPSSWSRCEVERGHPGAGRDPRGRPGRPLLRLRPHAGALPHRVLRAPGLRLAQLRELARGRRTGRLHPCQPVS